MVVNPIENCRPVNYLKTYVCKKLTLILPLLKRLAIAVIWDRVSTRLEVINKFSRDVPIQLHSPHFKNAIQKEKQRNIILLSTNTEDSKSYIVVWDVYVQVI